MLLFPNPLTGGLVEPPKRDYPPPPMPPPKRLLPYVSVLLFPPPKSPPLAPLLGYYVKAVPNISFYFLFFVGFIFIIFLLLIYVRASPLKLNGPSVLLIVAFKIEGETIPHQKFVA